MSQPTGLPGSPLPFQSRTLMIATVRLKQWTQSGPLPFVPAGQAFWADAAQAPQLVAAGLATIAPPNTPAPQQEPDYTVNSVPGLATGTSNASHRQLVMDEYAVVITDEAGDGLE